MRQGNTNEKVKIFKYVTEGTFDAYSWQLIENKQKFIGQIMNLFTVSREADCPRRTGFIPNRLRCAEGHDVGGDYRQRGSMITVL